MQSITRSGVEPNGPRVAIACPSTIVAAHRSPHKMLKYVQQPGLQGVEVIIAAGSGSAHLPGMIASPTTIPVIGIPLRSDLQGGTDSLFSILQMPPGVPVGTMGLNSSYNVGIFACQILSIKYPYLRRKLRLYKEALEREVESEDLMLKNAE